MGAGGVTGEHSISGYWLCMLYILYVGLLASHHMGLGCLRNMGVSSSLCIVENVLLPNGTQMAQGHQIINGDKYI